MWEQLLPPDKRGLPPRSTVQKATLGSTRDGGTRAQHTRIRSGSTSVEPRKSFFVFVFFSLDTPTHDGGGWEEGARKRWEGLVGKETFGSRSVQHCIQLVCQVVKHAADVVQDGDR